MKKPRILIIYTGGTIGMTKTDHGYEPVEGFADLLAKRLEGRTLEPLPDYDLIEFGELIDSANLHPHDWTVMANVIISNWDRYDGFVLLHGTDTMAYTASALSFILRGLNKSVIITGSQIPLIELRNDAFSNIVTSLILAADYRLPEVCLYFNGRILRGNRSRKLKSTGFDAFDSPNFPWLGTAGIHITIRDDLLLEANGQPDFHPHDFQADALSIVHIYPGLSANLLDGLLTNKDLRALVLLSYGVGNPPSKNKELMDRLATFNDNGVAVVNLTQCVEGIVYQGAYATGHALNRIGVIPGGDMTVEAAFAKLHCMVSQGYDQQRIRNEFLLPFCGECSIL